MTRAARFWPIAIVVLLAANVAGTVVMIRASGGEDANAVEPDYYRKSMAWDSIATARQQAAALGWTLRAQLGPLDAQGVAALDVTLLDRDGAPIDDALLGVEAIHNAHARHPVSATLAATAAGRYTAHLPLRWAGRWELRFAIAHAGRVVPIAVRAETAAR